jgi:hypothetical protein
MRTPVTDYKYLGKSKSKLIDRLKTSGHLLITPDVEEDFLQMSVKECRGFVNNVENLLRKLVSGGA